MKAHWISVILMAGISSAGFGQSVAQPHDMFALTTGQVAQAIAAKGIQIEGRQVSLLANVVAVEPHPILDVLSVEPGGDRRFGNQSKAVSLVKLGCHTPGVCLDFYAVVSGAQGTLDPAARSDGAFSASANARLKVTSEITMRAGTHATLVMNDNRSHIELAVISLESGKAGDKIHVTSPDHKQVYVAEVVGANLLERSF